jgi:hypothetical protein
MQLAGRRRTMTAFSGLFLISVFGYSNTNIGQDEYARAVCDVSGMTGPADWFRVYSIDENFCGVIRGTGIGMT